ncbi:hypothetical protein EON66_01950 [archaeon]|nr:MAG: hypothetical protein EON66_01950 [archaeon]
MQTFHFADTGRLTRLARDCHVEPHCWNPCARSPVHTNRALRREAGVNAQPQTAWSSALALHGIPDADQFLCARLQGSHGDWTTRGRAAAEGWRTPAVGEAHVEFVRRQGRGYSEQRAHTRSAAHKCDRTTKTRDMASEALVQAVRHALEVKGVLPRLRVRGCAATLSCSRCCTPSDGGWQHFSHAPASVHTCVCGYVCGYVCVQAELRFAVCSVVDDAERGEREYHVPDSSLFAVKHEPLVRTAMWLLLNFLDAYQLSSTKQCLLAEMGLVRACRWPPRAHRAPCRFAFFDLSLRRPRADHGRAAVAR